MFFGDYEVASITRQGIAGRRLPADRRKGSRGAILFVGDTLFAGLDRPNGSARRRLRRADASITEVLFPLGDDAIVHPGTARHDDRPRAHDQSLRPGISRAR
jgi:glyoxylase-like metal-dependent hydrolase (beta-lactamase superfamily II)